MTRLGNVANRQASLLDPLALLLQEALNLVGQVALFRALQCVHGIAPFPHGGQDALVGGGLLGAVGPAPDEAASQARQRSSQGPGTREDGCASHGTSSGAPDCPASKAGATEPAREALGRVIQFTQIAHQRLHDLREVSVVLVEEAWAVLGLHDVRELVRTHPAHGPGVLAQDRHRAVAAGHGDVFVIQVLAAHHLAVDLAHAGQHALLVQLAHDRSDIASDEVAVGVGHVHGHLAARDVHLLAVDAVVDAGTVGVIEVGVDVLYLARIKDDHRVVRLQARKVRLGDVVAVIAQLAHGGLQLQLGVRRVAGLVAAQHGVFGQQLEQVGAAHGLALALENGDALVG